MVRAADRRRRLKHSAEFKESVIQACTQTGVSMAAVAPANGLNANTQRKWVQESDGKPAAAMAVSPALQPPAPSFIAMPMRAGIRIRALAQRFATALEAAVQAPAVGAAMDEEMQVKACHRRLDACGDHPV